MKNFLFLYFTKSYYFLIIYFLSVLFLVIYEYAFSSFGIRQPWKSKSFTDLLNNRLDVIRICRYYLTHPLSAFLTFILLTLLPFARVALFFITLPWFLYFFSKVRWMYAIGDDFILTVHVLPIPTMPTWTFVFKYLMLEHPKYTGWLMNYTLLKKERTGSLRYFIYERARIFILGYPIWLIWAAGIFGKSLHEIITQSTRENFSEYACFTTYALITMFFCETRNNVSKQRIMRKNGLRVLNPNNFFKITNMWVNSEIMSPGNFFCSTVTHRQRRLFLIHGDDVTPVILSSYIE